MIERIIELSAKHRLVVLAAAVLLALASVRAMQRTPLDAIPDLTDPQVIVFTEWEGKSPSQVEDQVTYPLVRALESTPDVAAVRGSSMFGMSFVYVLFDEDAAPTAARARVLERLVRVQRSMPEGAMPVLGPDATGVGWVYQYVLEDETGELDLAELRELQDFTVRPALEAAADVAEVASVGGFEREFQIVLDPLRLAAYGVSVHDVTRAVRDASAEVGARVIELGGREYMLRGRGYVKTLADFEASVVTVGGGGTPVRLGDVARVQFGPEPRRGATDLDARGEAVGGIVLMRSGANALDVIDAVKRVLAELRLPRGIRVAATYDRSELIRGSIRTLTRTLIEEGVVVALICLVFLFQVRSALVALVVLPLSALASFIALRALGLSANIMSLAGLAIAVGELADAAIVLVENAHLKLAAAPRALVRDDGVRRELIVSACKEVGRPIFFSLLLIAVAFLPIFALTGQSKRLFAPLAYTKTFAMLAAAILSITVVPPLMIFLMRGRIRKESENPTSRVLARAVGPAVRFAVRHSVAVTAVSAALVVATIPVALRLGSEFMPPLDEGSLLVMPTTFAGISIEESRRALRSQHAALMSLPEVASVHGKSGRADTATDPAQLDMIESVVTLKPRSAWPKSFHRRWHTNAPAWLPAWLRGAMPEWLTAVLRRGWPEQRAHTLDELTRELSRAVAMPGYEVSIAPPIRTRIDMLTTGVRTPAGIKVLGAESSEIERLSLELAGLLRLVPGTRSAFAERQSGRETLDVVPDRGALARYGLSVRDVLEAVEAAVGGVPVSTVVRGRARFSVNVRYAPDFRSDPAALRELLLPVPLRTGGEVSEPAGEALGLGTPWLGRSALVTLGMVADVRVATGPPMLKNENGVLAGYVFADVDTSARDLGGWVEEAKALVGERLAVPDGYRLEWTGQYEQMAETTARLHTLVPLTLALIALLIFLALRGAAQTSLVLLSIPFAAVGAVWLLSALDYNLSTAAWVGLVAVFGVAAQTGIVIVVYLDEAYAGAARARQIRSAADVDDAVVAGATRNARPMVMTAATTVLGLMPLMLESGAGADVSARTAAPVVGGLASSMALSMLVLPAAYAMWRRWQLSRKLEARAPTHPAHGTGIPSARRRPSPSPALAERATDRDLDPRHVRSPRRNPRGRRSWHLGRLRGSMRARWAARRRLSLR